MLKLYPYLFFVYLFETQINKCTVVLSSACSARSAHQQTVLYSVSKNTQVHKKQQVVKKFQKILQLALGAL